MGRLIHKELAGIPIAGFSLAGEETVVALPEHNVCFDVGRAPREIIPIDNVCLTHGHMDHSAGLAYYLSQRAFIGNAPGRVIVHKGLAQPIQRLMEVWSDIEGHHAPGTIWGVDPLEDVKIRRDLIIRPFAVDHAASAMGFCLIETRHKLKPEFEGKTGPQLVALKSEGVQIQRHIEVPLVTYTGDTAVTGRTAGKPCDAEFLSLDFVQNSRVVILECTFFDHDHVSRARAGRHVHVRDLPRALEAIPKAEVLLTHVTRRTDMRHAKRVLEQMLGASDHDRVTFLMDRPPRRDQPRRTSNSERADSPIPS